MISHLTFAYNSLRKIQVSHFKYLETEAQNNLVLSDLLSGCAAILLESYDPDLGGVSAKPRHLGRWLRTGSREMQRKTGGVQ